MTRKDFIKVLENSVNPKLELYITDRMSFVYQQHHQIVLLADDFRVPCAVRYLPVNGIYSTDASRMKPQKYVVIQNILCNINSDNRAHIAFDRYKKWLDRWQRNMDILRRI